MGWIDAPLIYYNPFAPILQLPRTPSTRSCPRDEVEPAPAHTHLALLIMKRPASAKSRAMRYLVDLGVLTHEPHLKTFGLAGL